KFDRYLAFRRAVCSSNNIGIPYNLNDSKTVLVALVEHLQEVFPDKRITLRKHPKDKSRSTDLEALKGIDWSDPTQEEPFDFLLRQDILVAGNSSIHLEATLLNKLSVYL